MIKLNYYESQMMLFSKNHFSDDLKKHELRWLEDFIYALHHKVYLLSGTGDEGHLYHFRKNLIKLCNKLEITKREHYNNQIISSCFLDNTWDKDIFKNIDFKAQYPWDEINKINKVICLRSITTILGIVGNFQVKESIDGEYVNLIEFEEKDESLIPNYLNYLEEMRKRRIK